MSLFVEMWDGSHWRVSGRHDGGPPGSLTNNVGAVREVLLFACHGDRSLIERSIAGADRELGPGRELREVDTIGLEQLAELHSGETHELQLQTDRMSGPVWLRFRHADRS